MLLPPSSVSLLLTFTSRYPEPNFWIISSMSLPVGVPITALGEKSKASSPLTISLAGHFYNTLSLKFGLGS
ncbi:uncharacterized protein ASPGLDRAFT_44997 [Aspergillus glaucus CBS 516.65]|uniref:Uncharacterized protein n=1 Tax=Aspergillus glaucus CBS 516.65 TaxID=1160497 RepID=A0A1L9VQ28_ASPGL|nr:hypothetical protein ASPGLDRAFT_44997 [Aspergillus glaucus CBS 516.65]OJJ86001.1 hypothetical protein ASPGLDRAFT_44997 [Aspergillus glaucus CBS 516.65]